MCFHTLGYLLMNARAVWGKHCVHWDSILHYTQGVIF